MIAYEKSGFGKRTVISTDSPNKVPRNMKRESTLCAICGTNVATTDDHIPPKSLYPPPRDNDINLNTVPACTQCNNGASVDDEIFKVLVGIDTGNHQKDPDRIAESLAKTMAGNGRIANQVLSSSYRTYARLNGAILEPAVAVTFDFTRYQRVIERIVRGLHWMKTGHAMPSEATVLVIPGSQLTQPLATEFMELMQLLPLNKLNKGTFVFRWHVSPEGQQIWGMQFFGRHTTFAIVENPSDFTVTT